MKIVTWNVNSLKARQDFVSLYLEAADPDILCLQELKLESDKVPREMFEERGYQLAIHGQKQWNGVLIASKLPLTDVWTGLPEGDDGEARLVAATVGGVRLVNLYCPQGQSADSPKFAYKLRFYRALRDWLAAGLEAGPPLVVLGDLNVAPRAEDIYDAKKFENVPSFHPLEHEQWRALEALGLRDAVLPHIKSGSFSFWDYRGGAFRFNKGMRIDHVLVSEGLLPRVKTAWIDRDARKKKQGLTASDHAPVGIELL